MKGKLISVAALATLMTVSACSEGTGPGASGSHQLNLMIATAAKSAAAGSASVTVGTHTLVFDQVELVLDRIRLKRVEASTACGSDDSPAASDDHGSNGDADDDEHSDEPRDDQCEKFITGPLLLDLPLTAGAEKLISVDVDTGTYKRADFFIHKVSDDAGDSQFLADHPDLKGVSLRVTGTFDGTAFTYVNDITAKQKNTLNPPLVVTTAGATDLTFMVDVGTWFLAENGQLIDPNTATAGKPNENQVRHNIKRSFRVFKDHDHDGEDDHDDH